MPHTHVPFPAVLRSWLIPVMHRQLEICLAWREGSVEAGSAAAVGQMAEAFAP